VPYTVNDLAHVVAGAMGKECRIRYLEPRNEVKVAFSDHSKADRVFGASEKIALPDGIRAMAEWVERHGARESKVFENIEIAKNMPPSWSAVANVVG
jgi:UDP-glucose 4-epimerase